MVKEYVEREALEVALNHRLNFLIAENGEYDHYTSGFDEAVTRVENFPAADVVEVRHGRWIQPHWKNSNYCCNCSECGREAMHADYQWDKNGIYPLCPHCGAIMDVEEL